MLPEAYLYDHHVLAEEFRNVTAWPKHLLVRLQAPYLLWV